MATREPFRRTQKGQRTLVRRGQALNAGQVALLSRFTGETPFLQLLAPGESQQAEFEMACQLYTQGLIAPASEFPALSRRALCLPESWGLASGTAR